MPTLDELRARPVLVLQLGQDASLELGNLRGIVDPAPGRPDRPADGDELVSIHVNHDPALVNAYLQAQDPQDGPVVYLHGFVVDTERFPEVFVLSDHRDLALAGQEVACLPIASLDHPEVDDWPVFGSGAWEVQISLDPSQKQTRRARVQFSRALAVQGQAPTQE